MGLAKDSFATLTTTPSLLVAGDPRRHGLVIMSPAVNAVTISTQPGVVAGNGPTIRSGQSPLKVSVE